MNLECAATTLAFETPRACSRQGDENEKDSLCLSDLPVVRRFQVASSVKTGKSYTSGENHMAKI